MYSKNLQRKQAKLFYESEAVNVPEGICINPNKIVPIIKISEYITFLLHSML
jgi:hypothetical protein